MRQDASNRGPAAPDPAGIGRILVRTANWLGDAVLASPALRALRDRFPGARLALLARAPLAPLFAGHPHVDEVILDRRRPGDRSPFGPLRMARHLARHRFDLAVVLSRSIESALTVRLARIPLRAGLACHSRGRLFTHPLPETWERRWERHHAELHLEVVGTLGARGEARDPLVAIPEEARVRAETRLEGIGLGQGEGYLVVHPGASRVERTWRPDGFGRVARQMAEERGWRLLVVGTQEEREICDRTTAAAGPGATPLVGVAHLPELAALHAGASLVLANDSGPMHLAAAVGTPVVGVFGPGDARKTSPLPGGAPSACVSLDFPCSPCRQRFFRECRPEASGRPFCLADLPEERVLEAMRAVTAGRAGSAPHPFPATSSRPQR
jgi:lipopolysaccharide heptosyltransferase II